MKPYSLEHWLAAAAILAALVAIHWLAYRVQARRDPKKTPGTAAHADRCFAPPARRLRRAHTHTGAHGRNAMTSIALGLVLTLAAPFSGAEFVPDGPAVRVAQPPVYAEVAIKARMEGQAVVDVTIDEEGCVVATEAQGTNPLIAGSGRRAAAAWEFAAEPGAGERCATLVFRFRLVENDPPTAFSELDSDSPFSLTVAAVHYPNYVNTIGCRLENYQYLVDTQPWSVTFSEKVLSILPLR